MSTPIHVLNDVQEFVGEHVNNDDALSFSILIKDRRGVANHRLVGRFDLAMFTIEIQR